MIKSIQPNGDIPSPLGLGVSPLFHLGDTLMTNTVKKIYHHDSGHGWLAVKRKELIDLNIEGLISGCSYQKGETVYLEEDCDAGVYIHAMKSKGINVEFKVGAFRSYHPIRSYPCFSN